MKKINYRHVLCVVITITFILINLFVFPNALGRLIESGRDFGLSVAYYFCELFSISYSFTPTVTDLPQTPFFPFLKNYVAPLPTLPESWEAFKIAWVEYWRAWISKDNFLNYLSAIGDFLYAFSKFLLIVLPLFLIFVVVFKRITQTQNNDYDKESRPLQAFRRAEKLVYLPVKNFVSDFISFVRKNSIYWKIWLCIWLLNFNAFSIIIEFIAFYLYFVISFDVVNIYRQFYKLLYDLWTVITFIPLWGWIIIALLVVSYISRKIAYSRLAHRERCNRGFINERGVVTIVYGNMGTGKTALITDMALSAEVQLRDMAFEIILECDMKFPHFPWSSFEYVLRRAISDRAIYDVWSCRRLIRKKKQRFEKNPCPEKLYGYDFELYGMTYDDKLKTVDLWEVLEDYACAYLVYTVQSSLIVSNYSIRVDSLMSDLGNFPIWNTDFFKRDSRLMDSYSRHSHILDFDMLRLGKKMLENNPNRNAYGFGVYVVTEIDKERKNALELKDVKATVEECNQKNDLFNVMLKMSRHAVVIANRVFVKVIGDLQRPESLGADVRELGEVVFIDSQSETETLLPFFSPFYLFDLVYSLANGRFENFYTEYRYSRADRTLSMHLLKALMAFLGHYYERTCNLFGSAVIMLDVESGRMDGEVKSKKYYRQSKKIWAKRYSTDCLSGIFEVRGEVNRVGIDDLAEYADTMATNDELLYQNSHFQNELNQLK